jgi:SAM-dependent methyltransferase
METGAEEGGSRPIEGEMWGARVNDWAEVQEDTVLPLYKEVLAKTGIGKGTSLLDVGCGAGGFCRMAAERGASITGFDATPEMIDMAKSRTPKGDFRTGDMETLPFAGDSFHVVTGFNSFQYAANPVNALREARRVAKKDSFVVMAVWGKAADCQAGAYIATLFKFLPPPPPGAGGPFALSEDGALEGLARQAGLAPVEISAVDCPWEYKDLETALRGLLSAGPAVVAMQVSGEDRVRKAVAEVLEQFKKASGGYRMENKFLYLIARA